MVGSSKILTVSYGTFSCTLEGFEDSFSTMKAIAEYFRDLAADDRYFGAEPASPDADMLARIAEREVARRVEARTGATGIVLRATSALDAPSAARAQPDDAPASQVEPKRREKASAQPDDSIASAPDRTPMPPRPEAAIPSSLAQTGSANPDVDSVAAKLQRIRAVVGRSAAPAGLIDDGEETESITPYSSPASEAPSQTADLEDDLATLDRPDVDETSVGDAADEAAPVEAPTEGPGIGDPETLTDVARDEGQDEDGDISENAACEADAGDIDGIVEDEAEVGGILPDPAADEAAAIDGVETSADEDPSWGEGGSWSEGWSEPLALTEVALDDMPPAGPCELEQDEADTADANGEEAPTAEPLVGADSSDDQDLIAAIATAADDTRAAVDATAQPVDPVERPDSAPLDLGAYLAVDQDATDETDELLADLMIGSGDERPEPTSGPVPPAHPYEDALADEEPGSEIDQDRHWSETEEEAGAAERAPLPPRLIRMSRTEYQARFAGDLDAEPETDREEAPEVGDELGALSPEEEAGLMAELAALEAENADRGDEDQDGDAAESGARAFWDEAVLADAENWSGTAAPPPPSAPVVSEEADDVDLPLRRPGRAFVEPEADEASLARLMSRTEGELAAPEAQSRREAITGLKAAVAAAEAARQLGEGTGAADETAFRDDLRQVVRPRRPEPAETRSERPRPAPLKLVAAQRVDVAAHAGEAREPVRPRRVTADEAPLETGAVGEPDAEGSAFASFAQEMGATDLSDLLEAAAAFTAFVEGIQDFSRPQLVNKVREIAPDTFSREDELRSFGTLLRQGRIAKVRNGRFQVTEATRFHPERRAG